MLICELCKLRIFNLSDKSAQSLALQPVLYRGQSGSGTDQLLKERVYATAAIWSCKLWGRSLSFINLSEAAGLKLGVYFMYCNTDWWVKGNCTSLHACTESKEGKGMRELKC